MHAHNFHRMSYTLLQIADADSEKQRLDELVAHKSDAVQQLEEQVR